MACSNHRVLALPSLNWLSGITIPSKYFRLFVAADVTSEPVNTISEFALAALNQGMTYFCAWGPDCERFHDIVDEVLVEDDLGKRLFIGPNANDHIMTAWHPKDTLDEAIDLFLELSRPTAGYVAQSEYWVAVSVNRLDWDKILKLRLK